MLRPVVLVLAILGAARTEPQTPTTQTGTNPQTKTNPPTETSPQSELKPQTQTSSTSDARPQRVLKPPRAYTGERFDGETQDIPVDGQCHVLNGTLYQNVGSIDIPCSYFNKGSPICHLYRTDDCQEDDLIVRFTKPHIDMFKRPPDELGIAYVGGLVASIQCEDIGAAPQSTSGGIWDLFTDHISTQYPLMCNDRWDGPQYFPVGALETWVINK